MSDQTSAFVQYLCNNVKPEEEAAVLAFIEALRERGEQYRRQVHDEMAPMLQLSGDDLRFRVDDD